MLTLGNLIDYLNVTKTKKTHGFDIENTNNYTEFTSRSL